MCGVSRLMADGTAGARPCGTAVPFGKAARPRSRVSAVRAIHGGHDSGTAFPRGPGGSSGRAAASAPGARLPLVALGPIDAAALGLLRGLWLLRLALVGPLHIL